MSQHPFMSILASETSPGSADFVHCLMFGMGTVFEKLDVCLSLLRQKCGKTLAKVNLLERADGSLSLAEMVEQVQNLDNSEHNTPSSEPSLELIRLFSLNLNVDRLRLACKHHKWMFMYGLSALHTLLYFTLSCMCNCENLLHRECFL
jgi:hypothetical protein